MADEAAAGSVGTRVERAIERHADTAGEIQPRRAGEAAIATAQHHVAGRSRSVSLYLVFPSLVDTFSSWRQITRFSPTSLLVMFGLQVGVCACLWDLQRVALRGARWRPVIAAQLASNALSNIAPGGGPVGAALQYRIFVAAGLDGPTVVSALTAVNLLVFAVVLGLPVLAIPARLARLGEPQPARSRRRGSGRVRGDRRRGRAAAAHRPAAGVGGARRAGRSGTGSAGTRRR